MILSKCANPIRPMGGPKDEVPPKIVSTTPPNRSTNFTAKEVNIEFDEWVKLENVYKNLLISPPLKERPDFKIKKRSLVFKIEEELLDNTTYTFYLGDVIADITESNKFKNLEYVFSTGDYVDSLMLSGEVKDALSGEPMEDVTVMLYTTDRDDYEIDSLPYLTRPTYVAKTDETGKFELNSLRDIPYLIFVLKDQNTNYLYDLPNESIAFSDTLVLAYQKGNAQDQMVIDSLTNDTTIIKARRAKPLNLSMFIATDTIQKIISNEIPEDKHIQIILKHEASSYKFEAIENIPDFDFLIEEPNATLDTLDFWLKGNKNLPDSMAFKLTVDDQILDTLFYVVNEPEITDERRRGRKPKDEEEAFLEMTTNLKDEKIGKEGILKLEFNYPIQMIDSSKIVFIADSTRMYPEYKFTDSTFRKINFFADFDPELEYEVNIEDSAFRDIINRYSDSTYFHFNVMTLEDYGKLKLDLKSDYDCQIIIQMTNEKDILLREDIVRAGEQIDYGYLLPEKYVLWAIIDENNNGKWDAGNYSLKRQAEKIIKFSKVLEMRANWEMEEEWNIKN